MKELIGTVVATALLFGVAAFAVEKMKDRELFVPPPESIAEGFTRELMTRRWARAKEYLEEEKSDEELQAMQESLEAQVGEPTEIDAEVVTRDDDRALVNVRLSSAQGSAAVAYALEFEKEWKVVLE